MNIIHLSFVDMREKPTENSRVVSQALFGEEVEVFDRKEGWAAIKTPDQYLGWAREESLIVLERPYSKDLEVSRLKAHVFGVKDTEFGPLLSLPFGTKLHLIDADDPRWHTIRLLDGRVAYIQKGDVEAEPFELVHFCKKFLGLPYTWGGRSSFGYDCSGYVQMVFGRRGIHLPRDARQQVSDSKAKPVDLEELVLGDLIFWGHSLSDIRHVGIYLGGGEFIHTSSRENKPYLRISKLTDFEWSGNGYYSYRCARRY